MFSPLLSTIVSLARPVSTRVPSANRLAKIAGIEPTLRIEHLGGGLRFAQIARHHLRPLGQHPAPFADLEQRAALGIHDPNRRARQRLAGAAAAVVPAAAAGEHGAGFGEAVAHQQLDSHGLKEAIHVNRQGTATTDGGAQAAADQLLAHLRPEHPAGQAMQRPAQQGATGSASRRRPAGSGVEGAIRGHTPRRGSDSG